MFAVNVNGKIWFTEKGGSLLAFLRGTARLTAAKNGCGEGACGACMVLVDGVATRACLLTVEKAQGKNILTVEGLSEREQDVFSWAFAEAGAVQCGFCIPGMVISARALLYAAPDPTEEEIRGAIRGNMCRCTGYAKIVEAIALAARALRENFSPPRAGDRAYRVGERMPRVDVAEKVKGTGQFVDDMIFPDMLYGAALRSPTARALIKSVDASEAKKMPGVVAVLTAEDVPGKRYLGHIARDWPVMIALGEETRYIGDSIAIVAAETREEAVAAARRIELDYQELPPVLTVEEALAPDAPQIHPNGNVLKVDTAVKRGDVERALSESAFVVAETYSTPFAEHAFLEPECAIGVPGKDGSLTVYVGDQSVYDDHHGIVEMLGVPEAQKNRVRIVSALVGGGFGGKEDLSVQHHAALLAWKTGRPVKMLLARQESINVHPKRHPMFMDYTTGCDAEGRITAQRVRIRTDTGAYSSLGGPVLQRACTHATGPYRVGSVDIEGIGVYTNNPPAGAFRGFGVTQSAFAVECQMNLLAEKTGLSYWEIRYRNVVEPGDVLGNGQIVPPNTSIKETLLAAKAAYESSLYAGIACGLKNSGIGVGNPDVGRVRLEIRDGKTVVYTSAACIGQGLASTLIQIVSHVTGLPIGAIDYVRPDTFTTPDSGTTTASRQTVFTGEAARLCAEDLRTDLALVDGETPEEKLRSLEGKDYYNEYSFVSDPMGSDKPHPVSHVGYSYATHVAVLDEQGKVARFYAYHDVGQAINPNSVEGQIDGGVAMGLGYALTEDLKLEKGVPRAKYGSLGIWRANQMPVIERVVLDPKKDDGLAFGAKGVGEIVLVPPAPAIALAYRRFDGVFRNSLPLENTAYRKKKVEKEIEKKIGG
ncbi:MAG: selenium-dependent xanthine dehydrogenase [Synergistaceae bacterium]|jgi:selenium-dependent xanthine dehydrogenase|nr:selenium-dependent xanthine dehydrogenase [Synergistaceae bacterium]